MNFNPKLSMLLGMFAALSPNAHAVDYFCNNFVAADHPAHFQCVQTTVGTGPPLVISFDQAGSGTLFASSTSAGSGPYASTASASATASPGLLRGFASAEMLGGSIDGAYAPARSDAWFSDGGTIVGKAGVANGTAVKLRVTAAAAGGFAGGSFFHPASEATLDLVAGVLGRPTYYTNFAINKFQNSMVVVKELDALVGESFEMIMKLHVSANAVNDAFPGDAMSVADVGNTSHLYIDVLSENADFVSDSGHFYSSASLLPVPEPSTYALLLAGLCLTAAVARKRKLKKVS